VTGATHVLAKKNKAAIGTIGIQMALQDSFTKGVLVGKVNILLLTYPKLLIFLIMIWFHIVNNKFVMDSITISLA